eukprot:CAMPEP_0202877370 /NCGR_PEP_ID=MMETSP1391-20130828/30544_1 /ASSEMBLY_ACC=CAM_ASM_000867 /TAXON_ID=1034604 /ORGANISM="Chlamydomonas leiostraca, Strain SAG 11-49" /LENGTH=123 /DNA_ID=CAMNT_0049559397 /DNA_START=130 /DNA_END=499 /DNA_ORIENTATION=-
MQVWDNAESNVGSRMVGLDLEWRPDAQGSSNPIAVIQLSAHNVIGGGDPCGRLWLQAAQEVQMAAEAALCQAGHMWVWWLGPRQAVVHVGHPGGDIRCDITDVQEMARHLGYHRVGLATLARQ